MPDIDKILSINSDAGFNEAALELFTFQSEHCKPYKEYLRLIGVNPSEVDTVEKIPFLPIEFFKTREVYSGAGEPEIIFTSSTTGGGEPSRHLMERKSDYEKTFRKAFSLFYGNPEDISIYALLPSYLEREGSSLIYMIDNLIDSGSGGFYLSDYESLLRDMARNNRQKILLGVSYALWDLAEKYAPNLPENTIVMETGGMKGRREEIPKEQFHKLLCNAFGVGEIHSEYGMAELSSQAYSSGKGVFKSPPWMKIMIRDLNDPFALLPSGSNGGINIIDLANISSCAFIQTQDIGAMDLDGNFVILGRADHSEIRGCNLLIQ